MKLKKLQILAAIALLLGVLSSCGGGNSEAPDYGTLPPPVSDAPETEDLTDYEALSALPFENLAQTDGSSFTFSEQNGALTLLSYVGTDAKVRVPSEIDGKPIVAIADGAFSGKSTLTALYIPDSVTSFGKGILVGCSNLYALRTPLPTDADKAFLGYLYGAVTYETNNMADLRNLEFLELGGGLTVLPQFALYDCNDLVTLKLPASVHTLDSYSLYRCESLKYVNTEGLTCIKPFAMAHCAALSDLTFGDCLTEIGLGALEGCKALRNLTVPFVGGSHDENTYLGYIFGATEEAFSGDFYPYKLRRVTLLAGCTQIGDYAFYSCDSLYSVSIPEGVTSIGVRAFSGCVRLGEIALPGSVTTVREYAFAGCISLTSVSLGSSLSSFGIGAFMDCSALTEMTLPASLKALPSLAFSGCGRLERIDLGGVLEVGKNAFYRCSALSAVTASKNPKLMEGNDALKSLLDH